jgi:spore germination protein YaaH
MRLFVLLGLSIAVHLPVLAGNNPPSVHKTFRDLYRDSLSLQVPHPAPPGYTIAPRAVLAKPAVLRKEVFGYLPYWFRDRWNLIDYSLVTTIAYFDAEAAPDGSFTTINGWPRYQGDPSANASVVSMINAAHTHGVRVVLCVTSFTPADIDAIVTSPVNTNTFIQNALTAVQAAGADGVNINFEGINHATRDALTGFMHALADTFHTRIPGSQVSCAPTDFDLRYSGGDWDLPALSQFVDLFFVQGYGYGYSGSPVTMPVGLLPNTPFWGGLNITTLIDNVVLQQIGPEKVILGLPHYGYRWAANGPDPKTGTAGTGVAIYYPDALGYVATNGRLWDALSLNPWFRYQAAGQWYQGWYDDPESMSHKYQFALDRNLMGIGMWSLGMDGPNHDIWDVLQYYFSDSTVVLRTPKQPVLAFVKDSTDGGAPRAYVRWFANTEPYLKGYRLYLSTDPGRFPADPLLTETTLDKNTNSVFLDNLSTDSTYYVRLVAVDTSLTKVSDTTDTYGVRVGDGPRYLIVDGFDRVTASYNQSHHNFNSYYGQPLAALGRRFNSADNDAVRAGLVPLGGYTGVIWFLGDESVSDRTFDSIEQDSVKALLDRGGNLFVTGSEIGYDLGRAASPNYSPDFYEGYLKAVYAGDDAGVTTFTGDALSIFFGIGGSFGETYVEDYPDFLTPTGGSLAAMEYTSGTTAAVWYQGPFAGPPGKLLNMGFTFETIGSFETRKAILERIVGAFELVEGIAPRTTLPKEYALEQNFPNPFNPATTIRCTVPREGPVTLIVYDLLGRQVATLFNGDHAPGTFTVTWDAHAQASGLYFCTLRAEREMKTIKMLLQK